MVNVYFLDTIKLNKPVSEYLKSVSEFRKEKIHRLKNDRDKLLSLGGAILIDKMLKNFGIEEKNVTYLLNENGKPSIKETELRFSLSHSKNIVALAYSKGEIGIDVENCDKVNLKIAQRFFTKEENEYVKNAENPSNAFYEIWVKKESYIKYTGLGLKLPLNGFNVLSDEVETKFAKGHLQEIEIRKDYKCCICSAKKEEVQVFEVEI